jgi:GntR family transcriptional regulator
MPTPDLRAPHQRLADQLRADIANGRLAEGERLQPVRRLAEAHHLAPGTVQQAINALKRDGLVVSARGKGTRVAAGAQRAVPMTIEQLAETVESLTKRMAAVESRLHLEDPTTGGEQKP